MVIYGAFLTCRNRSSCESTWQALPMRNRRSRRSASIKPMVGYFVEAKQPPDVPVVLLLGRAFFETCDCLFIDSRPAARFAQGHRFRDAKSDEKRAEAIRLSGNQIVESLLKNLDPFGRIEKERLAALVGVVRVEVVAAKST